MSATPVIRAGWPAVPSVSAVALALPALRSGWCEQNYAMHT
jgi:hypothetical protein